MVTFFQELISIPAFPRPVPEIGWLGVVALAAWITYAVAGLRSTILVTATLLFFGVADQWQNSMDLLIITLLAVVLCIADRASRSASGWHGARRSRPSSRRSST